MGVELGRWSGEKKRDCDRRLLLEACVQLMVKEGISLDKEEVKKMPDATEAYLRAFKVELDKRKGLETTLNRQREENSALRTTLKTKSSICKCSITRTYLSPFFAHLNK